MSTSSTTLWDHCVADTAMSLPVVSWRQLERQSAREKERAADNVQALEQHYKQQVSNLQAKARSLEKDRNLLMVSAQLWTETPFPNIYAVLGSPA